jgi:diguanylate cyclase (GGDEF)-like protein/PAS domain S-box-containing protein
MSFIAFTTDSTDLSLAYHGDHSTILVVLSLIISVLAAFTSYCHRPLIQNANTASVRRLWLCSGAVAMGLGVWAMHFTGMMAMYLPVQVNYRLDFTLFSVLPAIAAALVTLRVISAKQRASGNILMGGVLMGAGIGSMHYIGMAAMLLQAERLYLPSIFVISILVAVALATLSLAIRPWLIRWVNNRVLVELISSLIMGLAIASMHYTAMHATVFLPVEQLVSYSGTVISIATLGLLAVVVAVAILLIATVAVSLRFKIHKIEQVSYAAMAQAKLNASRLQRIASRVPGLVYEFKLSDDGRFTFPYASDAIMDFYQISPEQAQQDAMPSLLFIHPDDRERLMQSIYDSANTLQPWRHEYRIIQENNRVRWLFGNAVPEQEDDGVSWSGFITDVTERKEADEKIHHLVFFDTLTGLYNRRKLQQSLIEFCERLPLNAHSVAVMLIDIDNFKRINDTQGHKAGDELLKQVAARIQHFIAADAICGRLSSDEFAILLTDLPARPEHAERQVNDYAQLLCKQMEHAYVINGHTYSSSVSVGYSLTNNYNITAEELLKQADIAVSHAKSNGGNIHQGFMPVMMQQIQQRFVLEAALSDALKQQQFIIHYQPQVTDDGNVIGVEALLRWHSPELGQVSPAEFIPLAEETGLIEEIGLWVLQQACQQLTRWHRDPQLAGLTMSVNISARQFYLPEFVSIIKQCLAEQNFAPECLMLELTESLVLADLDDAVSRMQQIKNLGVRFSMDDFGTGYSSLSYLSRLPFDEVKIDQFFVRSSSSDQSRDWVIVDAIIGIANTYGMKIIAEGVETEAQRELLRQSGCYCYQGYLYARPAVAEQTEQWIKQFGVNT